MNSHLFEVQGLKDHVQDSPLLTIILLIQDVRTRDGVTTISNNLEHCTWSFF